MLQDVTRRITGVIPLGFVVIHTFCMERANAPGRY